MKIKIAVKQQNKNCGCGKNPCVTYGLQKERLLYWGKLLKYIGLRVHRHDKKR